MAELSTLARPYAKAAFEVAGAISATSTGGLSASLSAAGCQSWEKMLSGLSMVLKNPEMQLIVNSPLVSPRQCYEVLNSLPGIFNDLPEGEPRAQAQRFVRLLVDNRRLSLMDVILAEFRALKDQAEGVAEAEVVSAFPLPAEEATALMKKIETRYGRSLKPNFRVDSALIGGVIVKVGDLILDQSVRGQLERMRLSLQT